MEIIAKTDNGFLITGTTEEVEEILRAVQGTCPEKITIGQRIPAIDYSATITKLKNLPKEYNYCQLIKSAKKFGKMVDGLQKAVDEATKIQQ